MRHIWSHHMKATFSLYASHRKVADNMKWGKRNFGPCDTHILSTYAHENAYTYGRLVLSTSKILVSQRKTEMNFFVFMRNWTKRTQCCVRVCVCMFASVYENEWRYCAVEQRWNILLSVCCVVCWVCVWCGGNNTRMVWASEEVSASISIDP